MKSVACASQFWQWRDLDFVSLSIVKKKILRCLAVKFLARHSVTWHPGLLQSASWYNPCTALYGLLSKVKKQHILNSHQCKTFITLSHYNQGSKALETLFKSVSPKIFEQCYCWQISNNVKTDSGNYFFFSYKGDFVQQSMRNLAGSQFTFVVWGRHKRWVYACYVN
jgi:hypothetical protein